MYQYTNGFSCALSGNGNEFVLCFAQQCPSFDSTDKLGKITKEPVASLIMSADKAKRACTRYRNALQRRPAR